METTHEYDEGLGALGRDLRVRTSQEHGDKIIREVRIVCLRAWGRFMSVGGGAT